VAIIRVNDIYGRSVGGGEQALASSLGMSVVDVIEYDPRAFDPAVIAARVAAAKPDFLWDVSSSRLQPSPFPLLQQRLPDRTPVVEELTSHKKSGLAAATRAAITAGSNARGSYSMTSTTDMPRLDARACSPPRLSGHRCH